MQQQEGWINSGLGPRPGGGLSRDTSRGRGGSEVGGGKPRRPTREKFRVPTASHNRQTGTNQSDKMCVVHTSLLKVSC